MYYCVLFTNIKSKSVLQSMDETEYDGLLDGNHTHMYHKVPL